MATGQMVNEALLTSKILQQKNISAEVVNFHTIKPIDESKILNCAKKNKLIITIEEHNIYGGLGSAVSECLSKIDKSPKMISYGVNDQYSTGGDYNFLKKKFKLDSNIIAEEILLAINT